MKKLLFLLIAFCAYTGVADANTKFDPAKFKAELHKYIIAEAHLTRDEANIFLHLLLIILLLIIYTFYLFIPSRSITECVSMKPGFRTQHIIQFRCGKHFQEF